MKTAIIYATKHGTTEFVAEKIKSLLHNDEVLLFNLNDIHFIELHKFDRILLGSSVYAGSILPRQRKFVEQNLLPLLQKEVGIFVCCMFMDKVQEQIDNAFPQILLQHAKSVIHVGGEFRFEEMNFMERFLVRKIAGVNQSITKINDKNIDLFIHQLNS